MSDRPAAAVRGGRAARQAARLHAVVESVPFITRTLAPLEVLSDEGLSLIEENADTILEQVGIDFRDAPDALRAPARRRRRGRRRARALPARPGRQLVQATAPRDVHAGRAEPANSRRVRRA